MRIASGHIVTLAFDISLDGGEIVESSDLSGRITVMHGSNGLIPGLDKRLEGLKAEDERRFELLAEEAFGTTDGSPKKTIARSEFPETATLTIGTRFEAGTPEGQKIVLIVRESDDEKVVVSMCHPLVDKTVIVELKIIDVRESTGVEKDKGAPVFQPPPPPSARKSA